MNSHRQDRPFRLALCESQPVTAIGFARMLAETGDMECAWTEHELKRGILRARLEPVHLLVLDAAYGLLNIEQAVEQLSRSVPNTAVVVWGAVQSRAEEQILQGGARGCIEKTASADAMMRCLRQVLAGGRWPDSANLLQWRASRAYSRLTPREKEIWARLVEKASSRQIARELGISAGTVKIHCRSIYAKLGVSGRHELSRSCSA